MLTAKYDILDEKKTKEEPGSKSTLGYRKIYNRQLAGSMYEARRFVCNLRERRARIFVATLQKKISMIVLFKFFLPGEH